jgi:hypothetical protein
VITAEPIAKRHSGRDCRMVRLITSIVGKERSCEIVAATNREDYRGSKLMSRTH